jgi:NADH-quinone oxidoreductase subunit N
VIIADLIWKNKVISVTLSIAGLIGMVIATFLLNAAEVETSVFGGMAAVDPFANFFKFLFAVMTIFTIWLSLDSRELHSRPHGEFFAILLTTALGMELLTSATDLLMIFLSLELVSITSYVLAGYNKFDKFSAEAALKYVIYGAVSSGIMLYGFSLLYGMTGQTNIYEIKKAILTGNISTPGVYTAIIFSLAGFSYKVASVPFHFWTPDVYEGAPTPVTAFFSVGPKAAGFGVLARFLYTGFSTHDSHGTWMVISNIDWNVVLAWMAVITMTLGNVIALLQNNIKRLLAYSSIAHAGYLMAAIVVQPSTGLQSMLMYLLVYYLMNMGAFGVVMVVYNKMGSDDISVYKGLGQTAPFLAISMAIFLFSLTGLPPTAGFVAKINVFYALVNSGWYWIALVGLLNSIVALYYYVRVIKVMFLDDPPAHLVNLTPDYSFEGLVICMVVPNLVFGIYFEPLLEWTTFSLRMLGG